MYLQLTNVAAGDLVSFMEDLLPLQAEAWCLSWKASCLLGETRSLLFVSFYPTQYLYI